MLTNLFFSATSLVITLVTVHLADRVKSIIIIFLSGDHALIGDPSLRCEGGLTSLILDRESSLLQIQLLLLSLLLSLPLLSRSLNFSSSHADLTTELTHPCVLSITLLLQLIKLSFK
jgi:hypothetical protein